MALALFNSLKTDLRHVDHLPANGFKVGCRVVVFNVLAVPGDGICQTVQAGVAFADQVGENVVLCALGNAVFLGCQFDNCGNVFVSEFLVFRLPHGIKDTVKLDFIGDGGNRVLNLHQKCLIRGVDRLLPVDLKIVLRKIDSLADVAALLGGDVDHHAVTAHKPIHEGHNGNHALPNFAIGDDNAGLHNVAGGNFPLHLVINDFDIHIPIRDFTGNVFVGKVDDPGENGQNAHGDFVVVNGQILV